MKKSRNATLRVVSTIVFSFFVLMCTPLQETPKTTPQVKTVNVFDVTKTTASCSAEVISDRGYEVTARGVCWSTKRNPTVLDLKTEDGAGIGAFVSSLTGLTPNTTYYVRAYATNDQGTAYGAQKTFTTKKEKFPNLVTSIRLDKSSLKLLPSESDWLIPSIEPENAENKKVTWSSSNNTIATVSENGKVTAGYTFGTATITATTECSGHKATCTVKVVEIDEFINPNYSLQLYSLMNGYVKGLWELRLNNESYQSIEMISFAVISGDRSLTYYSTDLSESVGVLNGRQFVGIKLNSTIIPFYKPIFQWRFTWRNKEYLIEFQPIS